MQERPCTRCIKRNIGHLCHDEPREPVRRPKGDLGHTTTDEEMPLKHEDASSTHMVPSIDQQQVNQRLLQEPALEIDPSRSAAQQPPVSDATLQALGPGQHSCETPALDLLHSQIPTDLNKFLVTMIGG